MAAVNARHLLVRNKKLGFDTRADLVLNEPEGQEAALYEAAKAMYLSAIKKSYVESCLLASNDLAKIGEILEMTEEALEVYRHYFFDVRGFDKLSRLEVVDEAKTDDEKVMKIWAMSEGLEFIGWRLGKPTRVSPVEGLQELYTLCVYKSKEALFSGNASDSSIEATKWTKLSMDLARLLKVWVMDNGAAKRDIELALKSLNPDFKSFDNIDIREASEAEVDGLGSLVGSELKNDLIDEIGDLNNLPE